VALVQFKEPMVARYRQLVTKLVLFIPLQGCVNKNLSSMLEKEVD